MIPGTTRADGTGGSNHYGAINTTETIDLNGVIELYFSYLPQDGDTYELIHAEGFNGGFTSTTVLVTGLNSGLTAHPEIVPSPSGQIFQVSISRTPVAGNFAFTGGSSNADWFSTSNWGGSIPRLGDDAWINSGSDVVADATAGGG